jgi:hypothetical protein
LFGHSGAFRSGHDQTYRTQLGASGVCKRRQKTETLVGVTKKQAEAIVAKRKAAVVAGELLAARSHC